MDESINLILIIGGIIAIVFGVQGKLKKRKLHQAINSAADALMGMSEKTTELSSDTKDECDVIEKAIDDTDNDKIENLTTSIFQTLEEREHEEVEANTALADALKSAGFKSTGDKSDLI